MDKLDNVSNKDFESCLPEEEDGGICDWCRKQRVES